MPGMRPTRGPEGSETIDVGVDVSAKQLRKAEVRGGYRLLRHADAASLPFADGTFATVISVSVRQLGQRVATFAAGMQIARASGHELPIEIGC